MINLPDGFLVTTDKPIDTRLVLTKAEMKAQIDARMPDKYLAICNDNDQDKGKLFIYDKNNEIDPELGKFRLYEVDVTEDSLSVKLPGALAKALDLQSDQNSGLIVDSMGNIKVNLNPDELEVVGNKIQFAWDVIASSDD